MQVIQHQYLHFKNLLTFETDLDYAAIPDFTKGIADSLNVLNLKQNGCVIIKINKDNVQFIIPVDKKFKSCEHYKYKEEIKIVNAVRVRHYGNFKGIKKTAESLSDYIIQNSMQAVTQPYYTVNEFQNDVYDVYIGISENVL